MILNSAKIEVRIALTEQFIERKKREYDDLVAELEATILDKKEA